MATTARCPANTDEQRGGCGNLLFTCLRAAKLDKKLAISCSRIHRLQVVKKKISRVKWSLFETVWTAERLR